MRRFLLVPWLLVSALAWTACGSDEPAPAPPAAPPVAETPAAPPAPPTPEQLAKAEAIVASLEWGGDPAAKRDVHADSTTCQAKVDQDPRVLGGEVPPLGRIKLWGDCMAELGWRKAAQP